MSKRFGSESGQALLIIVLLMVVASTVGLAVISRSVTNVRNSQDQVNSNKAFSAAEAGIEQALKSNNTSLSKIDLGNNATITSVNSTSLSGQSFGLDGGNTIQQDEGADLWYIQPNSDGSINYSVNTGPITVTLSWTGSSALEIIVLSGSSAASATSQRFTFDANSSRANMNHFSVATTNSNGQNTATFTTAANPIVARVVPLYANASSINISSSFTFPSQGTKITSTGSSGDAQRQITYYQGFPMLPTELFQYILLVPKG